MSASCENLDACGFFNNYKGNSEVIKQGWIRMFCESDVKSEKCKRKQMKRETGNSPVDNMAPTGDMVHTAS